MLIHPGVAFAPIHSFGSKGNPMDGSRVTTQQNAKAELFASLFHEDWWLNAASNGDWSAATIVENGRLIARMPYVVKRSAGLVGIGMPPLTRTLGPQFAAGDKAGAPQDYRRLVAELVAQLPHHNYFAQVFDPHLTHTLPFYALGFDSALTFTTRIPAGRTAEESRRAQRKQLRYDIGRAEQQFSVDPALGMDEFCSLQYKWLKETHHIWWSRAYQKRADAAKLRLFEACRARDCIAIFAARDSQSVARATLAVVWGHGVMYYWLCGRDSSPAASGAAKLLLSAAIKLAAGKGLIFDFDGFPRPSAVSMITGFGGDVVNRLTVSKFSWPARLAREIGARLRFGI